MPGKVVYIFKQLSGQKLARILPRRTAQSVACKIIRGTHKGILHFENGCRMVIGRSTKVGILGMSIRPCGSGSINWISDQGEEFVVSIHHKVVHVVILGGPFS